ncbi:MAG: sulfatase-like hydrolase/transferase [Nitrospirota bacterium]
MNFHLRLTINTSWVLFILKLLFFLTSQNNMKSIYLVSIIQDASLLTVNYFLFIYVLKRFKTLQSTGRVLFFVFYLIFGSLSFIYTFFLFDLLSFPVNIFGITMENISFFMEYFMSVKLLIAIVGGAVMLFWISYYIPDKVGWNKLPAVSAIIILLLFVPTVLRPAINPLVYSLQEQIILSFAARSFLNRLKSPTAAPDLKDNFRFLDKSSDTIPRIRSKYKQVIVLVMEGISHKDYHAESSADKNSFINRYRKNVVSYNNYHTLNLDSYTGLIAMLNSVFVPYQAYVDERKYRFVNERNNLVRIFNSNGFSTHFLTSYGEQQKRFVPDIEEWSETVYMHDIESNAEYACIKSSKIEYACEDLAVFDDLINILKNNPQPFVFQEMVYGHTSEWKEKTGIKIMDYYNQYFNKIVKTLKSNNLSENVLLVILSDHGPRDNAYTAKNYHIPLLVWANDLTGDVNNDFISHIDFKDVLLKIITGDDFIPKQYPIYTLGHSGEFIYGKITADDKYVFINNRMLNLESNMHEDMIKEFNHSFQDYLNYFESLKIMKNE